MRQHVLRACASALFVFATVSASAQTANEESEAGERTLSLELNTATPTDNGCRLALVAQNEMGAALSKAAFEMVLFNQEGLIEQLLIMDFGAMPAGKTKVRQFDLSGTACDTLGRVLVNSVSSCEAAGSEELADNACSEALSVSSKVESIDFTL